MFSYCWILCLCTYCNLKNESWYIKLKNYYYGCWFLYVISVKNVWNVWHQKHELITCLLSLYIYRILMDIYWFKHYAEHFCWHFGTFVFVLSTGILLPELNIFDMSADASEWKNIVFSHFHMTCLKCSWISFYQIIFHIWLVRFWVRNNRHHYSDMIPQEAVEMLISIFININK